ncbi:adenylyl-sulfate kinase [Nocardia gipuzkoensis]
MGAECGADLPGSGRSVRSPCADWRTGGHDRGVRKIVLVAAIGPLAEHRDRARRILFHEVHVDTPLAECEQREVEVGGPASSTVTVGPSGGRRVDRM